MRQYIRHPIDMPIEIRTDPAGGASALAARDISVGGLALRSARAVAPGTPVEVRIPFVEPAFEARARVVWCRPRQEAGYDLGVTFLDAEDAYLARMVEQICHIEDYRRSVWRNEGRQLDPEQAAAEWIARYAAQFPGHSGLH
ncbi:MAG: PilZ domain-containing protein [Leptothrix sp. (in: b-proteobacteria)]